jgi:hypothetical protein
LAMFVMAMATLAKSNNVNWQRKWKLVTVIVIVIGN